MPVEFLSAVIVVSEQPEQLASFYIDAIGLPLRAEQHNNDVPHWGATLGQLHFAIHDVRDFPEHHRAGAGAVVVALATEDLDALLVRLRTHNIEPLYPPKNLGWTTMTAVHDPDGNLVELTQMADEWWAGLERRRLDGHDPVVRSKKRASQT